MYSLLRVVSSHMILWIFTAGGFRLKVVGRQCRRSEAPVVTMAPHSSFIDSIAMVYMGGPSIVAKGETASIPFFGSTFAFLLTKLHERSMLPTTQTLLYLRPFKCPTNRKNHPFIPSFTRKLLKMVRSLQLATLKCDFVGDGFDCLQILLWTACVLIGRVRSACKEARGVACRGVAMT